ncbi:PepSY-like domain-containing protein [Candidatus Poribacteria bacterium]|nr:PepSY-like domain-containing protein [Candidatus Poribacteria bacterium]
MNAFRKFSPYALVPAAFLAGAAFFATADEAEEKEDDGAPIAAADIPAAVRKTAESAVPGAAIQSAVLEDEDGAKVYEVKLKTADGREIEVMTSPDGALIEIEESVTEQQLPAAVLKTLHEVLPGGKTDEIEKKTVVVYEIEKEAGGSSYELLLDSNGGILSIEAEHEDGEHEDEAEEHENGDDEGEEDDD